MHHYHKLREKLDTHPSGAPGSKEFLEILKILFHSDEVELATYLEFKLQKGSEAAKKAGIEPDEASRKLEAMADRGSVLARMVDGEYAYACCRTIPGCSNILS
jgi:hypothetical protein